MPYYIPYIIIMDVDTGLSCLLVRDQHTGFTFAQDSDEGVRPHKPKTHHGTALLQGYLPELNLLLTFHMAVLHWGFIFRYSAK